MSKVNNNIENNIKCNEVYNYDFLYDIGDKLIEPEIQMGKRIGIVGAGLAGLTAAYRLKQAGYTPIIFEGSGRIGGRCFSGKFHNGQVYEHGGELIDTYHTDIQNLVAELGLELDDVKAAQNPNSELTFQVIDYDHCPPELTKYTYTEAFADYQLIFNRIITDTNNAYPATYDNCNEAAIKLDRMTLEEYIDDITSILRPDGKGAKSKMAQLLKVAYTGEYGSEPYKQSPLNLIFLLGFGKIDIFELFGISDERYHIKGGNSLLVRRLVEELIKEPTPIQIRLHHKLTKIKRLDNSKYRLYFESKDDKSKKDFDHIILAIPFSIMRTDREFTGIDFHKAGFSSLKKYAINNLGMGKNAKLNVQFKNRYWNDLEYDGTTYATNDPRLCQKEKTYQSTWEVTRGQDGDTGVLVNFVGGEYTKNFHTSAYIENGYDRNKYIKKITKDFLYKLNPVLPGSFEEENFAFDGYFIQNVVCDNWSESQWHRGSYSYWKSGQYCGGKGILNFDGSSYGGVVPFAGVEQEAEPRDDPDPCQRNCHFAGEHTSIESQGFLNGAVESGNRVAQEIIDCMNNICPRKFIKRFYRA